MSKIFISYDREDIGTARKLYDDLKDAGLDVWLDDEDLIPGQNWKKAITKAIRESRFFIALISTKSVVKKGFVQTELKKALDVFDQFPDDDIFLIPARIDNCDIPERLADLHCADLFPEYERGFGKLLKAFQVGEATEPGKKTPARFFKTPAEMYATRSEKKRAADQY
ncbi:toll/interleukin-1 receptor domain-containing protein [Desulfococcaceae bacterium HSG8]|nr:toll/interleukin-1 receptor domain-containing protein [Desulfococcaceae bacterium HSG8]